MCGIAGFLNFSGTLQDEKFYDLGMRMAERLSHRGPDAKGICVERHAVLAVAELKFADTKDSIQPMQRERYLNRYTICYNGEIYNTKEIKRELSFEGVCFETDSDAEVLLMAYITYGKSFVYLLNGIFAFVIWDEEKQELFMCRDRFGVKPLYYTKINDFFVFASEPKALFEFPGIFPVINEEGLCEIFGSATPSGEIFDNIFELKPATYKTISRFSETEKVYYKLHASIHTDNLNDTVDTIRYLLKDSISRQSIADVPACTFLSDNISSNYITAVAAKNKNIPLTAYSLNNYNEPANEFKVNHIPIKLSPEQLISDLYMSAEYMDFPDFSYLSPYLFGFSREVKKNHCVALSDTGANEIFGVNSLSALNMAQCPNPLLDILSCDLKNLPIDEYSKSKYENFISDIPEFPYRSTEDLLWREAEYLSIYRTAGTKLSILDRMSMASSLEVRVPYLDHRLVSYMWNIPKEMKIKNGQSVLLYEIAHTLLPETIINQKYEHKFMPDSAYENLINLKFRDVISNHSSPILQLINKDKITSDTKTLSYIIKLNHWLLHNNISIRF